MLPQFLNPAYTEIFRLEDNRTIEIPKCVIQFQKWNGTPVKETFGGKPIVSVDGQPMFAEIAVMTHFINNGWQARWIETYSRGNKEPVCLTEWKDDKYVNQKHEPVGDEKVWETLSGIAKLNNNSYSGCWDILAWKNGIIIFAESKRNNKDLIRQSQNRWLAAGLSFGLRTENFLLVQWDFNPRCMA